jgi:hypothetical protein
MLPVAERTRAAFLPGGLWSDPGPFDPEPALEAALPVACVALPELCLDVVCRYLVRHNGRLPEPLSALAGAAGPAGGRPVRGACIAWRGKGLLVADERDPPEERRFSLAHEAAHFLADHLIPREDAVRRLGPAVRDVLDGRRAPSISERFHAVLRGAELEWHAHLYDRRSAHRSQAEADADALACLLLSPPFDVGDLLGRRDQCEAVVRAAHLPPAVADGYRAGLALLAEPPRRAAHPLIARLGRQRTADECRTQGPTKK